MLRHTLLLILVSICMSLPARCPAQDYPDVVFILDASGSMEEDIDGQRKIDAAKEVMGKIVPQLAPEVQLGLVAYGHRRKADCSDVEVLVAPGSTDRESLLRQVNALEPKGKTPIAASILTVAGMRRTKEVEAVVVLVSDGIETCGGDPCQVTRELKATGCPFVVHTVGFDVDDAAAQQLAGIASASGGKYFGAQDPQSLMEALQMIGADVAQRVAAAKTTAVYADTGLGTLRITMPERSERGLSLLQITRNWDHRVLRRIDDPKAVSTTPLPSGKYSIVMGFATPNYGAPTISELGEVTIRNGETYELRLGSISLIVPKYLVENDWQNRLNIEKVILAAAGTDAPVVTVLDKNNGAYDFVPKPVVAGLYDVQFQYATNTKMPTVVARHVPVTPGKNIWVTLDSGLQFKHTGADITGWDLLPDQSETASEAEDGGAPIVRAPALSVRAFSAVSGGPSCLWYPYVIPPGRYDIVVYVKGMTEPLPVGEDIHIGQGEMLRFDAGI